MSKKHTLSIIIFVSAFSTFIKPEFSETSSSPTLEEFKATKAWLKNQQKMNEKLVSYMVRFAQCEFNKDCEKKIIKKTTKRLLKYQADEKATSQIGSETANKCINYDGFDSKKLKLVKKIQALNNELKDQTPLVSIAFMAFFAELAEKAQKKAQSGNISEDEFKDVKKFIKAIAKSVDNLEPLWNKTISELEEPTKKVKMLTEKGVSEKEAWMHVYTEDPKLFDDMLEKCQEKLEKEWYSLLDKYPGTVQLLSVYEKCSEDENCNSKCKKIKLVEKQIMEKITKLTTSK